MKWAISRRAQQLTSSAIREILKVTERPEVISFAGGLPSPASFPVAAMEAATARVSPTTRRRRCNMPRPKATCRCASSSPGAMARRSSAC